MVAQILCLGLGKSCFDFFGIFEAQQAALGNSISLSLTYLTERLGGKQLIKWKGNAIYHYKKLIMIM